MRKFLHINKKSGFTLTELCVVMAIVAIVGAMTTTCVIYFSSQKREITSQAVTISEISTVKNAINDWLRVYDSSDYEIKTNNTLTAIESCKKGDLANASTLTFDKIKKTVTVDGIGKTDEFKSITNLYFDDIHENEKTVKVTVVYGKKDEKQILLLPLFSGVTRERVIK